MNNNGHIAQWLAMMEAQHSLTLQWDSFFRWGRERIAFSFCYDGGQYCVYSSLQPVAPQITQDTRPTIVDASLMLIFRIG